MPKIKKAIEKICTNCWHYILTVEGPRCDFYDQFFPDPVLWVYDSTKKKPGERTCENWMER